MLFTDVLFYFYVVAVGFVSAGLSASLHQLLTGEPLAFACARARGAGVLAGILLRVAAGPAILMRNALKGARAGRPAHWLALSTVIASLWSFFSGVLMLELLLRAGLIA